MSEERAHDDRVSTILSDLDSITSDDFILPSSVMSVKNEEDKKKEKKKHNGPDEFSLLGREDESDEEWLESLTKMPKLKCKKRLNNAIFEAMGEKKGKKKKKKKGDMTDFKKEFDPEVRTIQHLLVEQNDFVSKLQASYNMMTKTKSSSRGIGKFENDLIANINTARKTSYDLAKGLIDAKKTIADLTMKERKEFGSANLDGDNMSDYASGFLKQLISADRKSFMGNGDIDVEDVTEDAIGDQIFESMTANDAYEERSDEVSKYLKYENENVKVKVILHPDETYDFVALDDHDNVITDYPVPSSSTQISINRSTMRARDNYGVSYELIIE